MTEVSNTQPVPLAHIFTGRNQEGQYMKGCIIPMTEEHKRRISEALKGRSCSWSKGVPRTEETKRRISRAKKGTRFTLEHRHNLSNALKGNKCAFGHRLTKKTRQSLSQSQTRRFAKPEEHEKLSLAHKGKKLSPEHIRGLKGRIPWTKGHHHKPESNHKNRLAHLGKHHTEETKRKMRERWTQEGYRSRVVKAQKKGAHVKPNKKELFLSSFLRDLGLTEFQYVGDGKLIIAGKCPDYTNWDHKLIELYGTYWHAGENPQDRIDFFKQRGYDCLVIWESELRDQNALREKLLNFTNGG